MRIGLLALACVATAVVWGQSPQPSRNPASTPYVAQNYEHLIGMPGFSEKALRIHFTLYELYVKNTNTLLGLLKDMNREGKSGTPCWNEIHRRLGWEWDGMRLHEYYFGCLGGDGTLDKGSDLYKALVEQHGSYEAWLKDFKAVGSLRGVGWAILYLDPLSGRLLNCWITEHPDGHPAGADPLLPMDVWEHAYMVDYGLDRGAYIDAFFKNVDWKVVSDRYAAANRA
jgi:superoxide dismutase, Fe-Mn family